MSKMCISICSICTDHFFLTKLLGVSGDASNQEIIQAFRQLAKEKHPDKNPEDVTRATNYFQVLTRAKIALLDPEKRRDHDADLVDSGVRNFNALPIICSICSNARSSGTRSRLVFRCLNGHGHRSHLADEFEAYSKEYDTLRKSRLKNEGHARRAFAKSLQESLKDFIASDLVKLYPRTAAPKQKFSADKEPPIPEFATNIIRNCQPSSTASKSSGKRASTATDVIKILDLSLVRKCKKPEPKPSTAGKLPIYDISRLSSSEVDQIHRYFCPLRSVDTSFDSMLEDLNQFIPATEIDESNQSTEQKQSGKACQRCKARRQLFSFLDQFTACFICKKICCRNCLLKDGRKIPTSGSYDVRPVCKECLVNLKSDEAEKWLQVAQSHFRADTKCLQTILAMYKLSYELCPSKIAIELHAQALFQCQEAAQLAEFGKEILSAETTKPDDVRNFNFLIAGYLQQLARSAHTSNPLEQADNYECLIEWIEHSFSGSDACIHNMKVQAMRKRWECIQEHEQIAIQRGKRLSSELIVAIRESSLLKVVTLLQHNDEDVMVVCLRELSKESPENYYYCSKLLLSFAQAVGKLKRGNDTSALNQVADVFWTGYPLFNSGERSLNLIDYVIHLVCELLKSGKELSLEGVKRIEVRNFLECLQLTEDIVVSPPDISKRNWENLYVEGCNTKMFQKYEEAVRKLVQTRKWSAVDAALSYYDLILSSNRPSQMLVTLITSAQWFAKEISSPKSDRKRQYQCKKMLTKLTNTAAALAHEFGVHPYLQYYTARMVLGLQFFASFKTGFGNQEDVDILRVHLKWFVAAGRLCPLHEMPIVTPTESVLLQIISQNLHCEYLLELQDEVPPQLRPMSEAVLRYHIYENHMLKRNELHDPTGVGLRLTAMSELLYSEGWTWDAVQRLLQSNIVSLDTNGWLTRNQQLSGPVASSGIGRLVGMEINKNDFNIQLLVKKSKPHLLCWEDIATGLIMEQPGSFFSLEAVKPQETHYHPFNEQIFEPKEMEGSQFLYSLFHTDYLLKQFSTGFELSAYPPFHVRFTSEGLLERLPDDLKYALSSIPSRGQSQSRVRRLWIQADAMEFDVQEDKDYVRWLFGEVQMAVRCMPMFHTEDGKLQDQEIGPDSNSPEGKFVADFTKHYDQIGKYFPEFLRLKELCKAQFLGRFLGSFEESLIQQKAKLESREMEAEYQRIYSSVLQKAEREKREQLGKIRREIRSKVAYINDDVVRQVQQAGIPGTYHQISDWLRYGDSNELAQRIARDAVPSPQKIRQQIIAEHESKLRSYQAAFAALKKSSKECLPFSKLSSGCRWVPAVSHCEEDDGKISLVYGGVALTPKLRNVPLQVGGFFSGPSKVPLTSNLLRRNAKVEQPHPKAFNPPRFNGTKPPSSNGSGAAQSRHGGIALSLDSNGRSVILL